MPQVFQVLRCYECRVFQVHQVKMVNKWQCKMCGEKQSRKQYYGIGTAKECRGHVQKLNGIRGEKDQNLVSYDDDDEEDSDESEKAPKYKPKQYKQSKWKNFVQESDSEDLQDNMQLNNIKVVPEVPKKIRKKFIVKYSDTYTENVEKDNIQTIDLNEKQDLSPKFNTKSKRSKWNNFVEEAEDSKNDLHEEIPKNMCKGVKTYTEDLQIEDDAEKTLETKEVHSFGEIKDLVYEKEKINKPSTSSEPQSSSKWSQFVEKVEIPELSNENNEKCGIVKKKNFSLFEDEDIEDILNL